jgi:hypothetical protein
MLAAIVLMMVAAVEAIVSAGIGHLGRVDVPHFAQISSTPKHC